jgi:hypothetical protein
MGVNLVPIVRKFRITEETFAPTGDHSVQDGCVTPGTHRLLRFDFLSHNMGDTDLVVGSPAARPDLFEFSAAHGHYHLKNFNEFKLFDTSGNQVIKGYKQAFCLIDVERINPLASPTAKFQACNTNQGVSAGWADLYDSDLPCQFIVIDGVLDGNYTLLSTTNLLHIVHEDTYDDNTICTGLKISGNTVAEILPPIKVQQLSSAINFNDVPEGETTVRAAVFEVRSCRAVNFQITSGPTVVSGPTGTKFDTPLGTLAGVSAGHTVTPRHARVWISYTGTKAGDTATGNVTVHCAETNENFVIPITANTVKRPTVATMLVLDKSGSMNEDAGDGRKRIDVLHDSAPTFVELLGEKDAIGIVAFDQDAYDVMPITPSGPLVFGAGRTSAKSNISSHTPNPSGTTSIGDGVEHAHALLAPIVGYDMKAMIVLTDGQENTSKYIADVISTINDHVFAIGLGTPEAINPKALTALTNGTGGYLLMTGQLDQDDYYRLSKYYLQILAGVTNKQVVLDPEGWLAHGQVHRIPFSLTETDISSDIILLSSAPRQIRFTLETPSGQIIEPSLASGSSGISYVVSDRVSYYRITLPVLVGANEAREGTWHAVLTLDDIIIRDTPNIAARSDTFSSVQTHGVHYSLNVHTYSNLRMQTSLSQTSQEPGATLTLRAVLTEYDFPVENRANVQAEFKRPDKTTATLTLAEVEPGVFETTTAASMPGIYSVRALGTGTTLRGRTFTREQLLTGAVWKGGNSPLPTSKEDPNECCRRTVPLLNLGIGLLVLLSFLILIVLSVVVR